MRVAGSEYDDRIEPYKLFMTVDGALYTSSIVLDALVNAFEELGENNVKRAKLEWRFPNVLPLNFCKYYLGSIDDLKLLKKAVDTSKKRFESETYNFGDALGTRIIVCGFPKHVRAMIRGSGALEVRVALPPEADRREKSALAKCIDEFRVDNPKVDIGTFDKVSYDEVYWADSIVCETNGILDLYPFGETYVYIPAWIADLLALNTLYGHKPSHLVFSKQQSCPPKGLPAISAPASTMKIDGRPVSIEFFNMLINDEGISQLHEKSFLEE